jgi:hypothetical protein
MGAMLLAKLAALWYQDDEDELAKVWVHMGNWLGYVQIQRRGKR